MHHTADHVHQAATKLLCSGFEKADDVAEHSSRRDCNIGQRLHSCFKLDLLKSFHPATPTGANWDGKYIFSSFFFLFSFFFFFFRPLRLMSLCACLCTCMRVRGGGRGRRRRRVQVGGMWRSEAVKFVHGVWQNRGVIGKTKIL